MDGSLIYTEKKALFQEADLVNYLDYFAEQNLEQVFTWVSPNHTYNSLNLFLGTGPGLLIL